MAMKNWSLTINNITRQTLNEFGTLTVEQLNWKPNSNTWSIAQNIHHLIVVNETYFPVFASLIAGTYNTTFIANSSFLVSFFGKTVLKAVQPDRLKKMKTFSIWEPNKSNISNLVLIDFENHQNQLIQNIDATKELVQKGVVIASPANKHIVYTLETAFDIIVSHEQRHLEQAKEVLAMLTNSKAFYN